MKSCWFALATLLAGSAYADDLMEDCAAGDRRHDMQCINRNGVCVEVTIDGHKTVPIRRADKQRLAVIPDTDALCWQVLEPVSARFRVEARGGGLGPDFVGAIESLGGMILPFQDFDPEFDRRVEPLNSFDLEADGYRDGSWQLKQRDHFQTPGAGELKAGEYIAIIRVHGVDNWDKQEVLIRIDPGLEPAPENPGSKPEHSNVESR